MTADEYLREVEFALRDLPWSQRRDLVADLRDHLAELPPETDLVARLGKPRRYASDLRAAEGLEHRRGIRAYLRARRPRNVILVGLLLVMLTLAIGLTIGLTIGGAARIDNYQPLRFGSAYRYPDNAHSLPGIEGESVDFHRGRPFEFGMEITNSGRFTVRVLGVPYLSAAPWHAQLRMGPPSYGSASNVPSQPFRSFDLHPGQSRFLFLKGVYWCTSGWDTSGSVTFSHFPVRYSFLGRTKTASIRLPEDLAINFTESCPSGGIPWPGRSRRP